VQYIDNCIASLERIGQALPIEVIVQDAGSTDGTGDKVAAVVARCPNWRHFVEKDNGQSDAINRGMARARGEWVTWLCADDILLPDFPAAFTDGVQAGADVIYGDVVFATAAGLHPADGTETHRPGLLARRRLVIQQPGTVMRCSLWREVGGVDIRHNWAMDYDLFLRLEAADARFHRAQRFVAAALLHEDAKTSSPSLWRPLELWRILAVAHWRRPAYFRPRPYALYLFEYLIKWLETGPSGPKRAFLLRRLHNMFWRLARPREHAEIGHRFAEQREALEPLISPLMAQS
jgi:glycosyltransferase involved in cell wall biosynthesis